MAGHSAGAHLAVCLYNGLVQQAPLSMSIVKSLYLIAGVYDLSEIRFMPGVNPNNILSLDDRNVLKLSPIAFDYDKWTELQTNASTTAIHLFIGTNDAPKLIEHSHQLDKLLTTTKMPDHHLIVMNDYDHFNIVEDLSQSEFLITKMIIDEAKRF